MARQGTNQARIIEMHLAGMRNREIASALGLAYGTVGRALSRARERGDLPSHVTRTLTAHSYWGALQRKGAAPRLGMFTDSLCKRPPEDATRLMALMQRDDQSLLDALLRLALDSEDGDDARR